MRAAMFRCHVVLPTSTGDYFYNATSPDHCRHLAKPSEHSSNCRSPCAGECVVSHWSEWSSCAQVTIATRQHFRSLSALLYSIAWAISTYLWFYPEYVLLYHLLFFCESGLCWFTHAYPSVSACTCQQSWWMSSIARVECVCTQWKLLHVQRELVAMDSMPTQVSDRNYWCVSPWLF